MKEIEIQATIENLPKVMEFIDVELEALECSMKVQTLIDISVEELFVNIANYAYGDKEGKAIITFSAMEEPKGVEISLKDCGMFYDPLAKEDPDITLSAEERQIGGLGIFMVKKNMDEVNYEYKDGWNITTIYKKL